MLYCVCEHKAEWVSERPWLRDCLFKMNKHSFYHGAVFLTVFKESLQIV